MALYLISYDVKEIHSEQYAELRRTLIEDLEATCILESVWLVEEEADLAEELAAALCDILKSGDGEGLIAIEVTADAGFCKLKIKDDVVREMLQNARAACSRQV